MRIRLTGERGYQNSVIDWDGDFAATILLTSPGTLKLSEYNFQSIDADGLPVYAWAGREGQQVTRLRRPSVVIVNHLIAPRPRPDNVLIMRIVRYPTSVPPSSLDEAP